MGKLSVVKNTKNQQSVRQNNLNIYFDSTEPNSRRDYRLLVWLHLHQPPPSPQWGPGRLLSISHETQHNSTAPNCTLVHLATIQFTALHYTEHHLTALHWTVLHYTEQHWTTLHQTEQPWRALYCTVLNGTTVLLYYKTILHQHQASINQAGYWDGPWWWKRLGSLNSTLLNKVWRI